MGLFKKRPLSYLSPLSRDARTGSLYKAGLQKNRFVLLIPSIEKLRSKNVHAKCQGYSFRIDMVLYSSIVYGSFEDCSTTISEGSRCRSTIRVTRSKSSV